MSPTSTLDFLDALRLFSREALSASGETDETVRALDAARVRAAALDVPPLLVRVAQGLALTPAAAGVLELVAAGTDDGAEVRNLGPVVRATGDSEGVWQGVRELQRVGLVDRRERRSPTEPLSPVTMEAATARALMAEAPSEADIEAAGLRALLAGGPAFDPDAEGMGRGAFADDLDFLEAASALVRLWDERHDASRGASVHGASVGGTRSLDRRQRADRRIAEARVALGSRLEATREAGRPLPRLVALGDTHGLSAFERDVLVYLCCSHVLPSVRAIGQPPDVEDLVDFLAPTFRAAVHARRSFYRDAPLVRAGLVDVEMRHGRLGDAAVRVDQQTVDHVLGLDAEGGAVHEGTHLFTPSVRMCDVHLPEAEKARVLDAVGHAAAFERARADLGLDDRIAYGRGLVLLFHGPPGTGKTMLAHALAAHVGRRLLLVNEGAGFFQSDERVFRSLLREARLADAVLFFDEAEAFFGGHVPALLTELERYDGLVVLATNRPETLDAAMRRRCTVSVRFEEPAAGLRARIWESLLPERARAGDVDLAALAERFALPGGHAKNAVLTAVTAAAARAERAGGAVRVTQADLVASATAQVHARAADAGPGAVVPRGGLERLVFAPLAAAALRGVVALERERPAVLREWGFGGSPAAGVEGGLYGRSTAVLLEGPPGTGKTAAAEALAFDLGRPLHVVTSADVADKYVGETAKRLRAVFETARAVGAVLVLDEADALLEARGGGGSASDRYANADVSVLLREIERHDGLVVLTTNRADALDPALARRLWLRLALARPGVAERRQLWARALPAACPRAADVDPARLAAGWALSGAEIERAAYRAAASAALDGRVVCEADLEAAASAETGVPERRVGFAAAA